MTVVALLKTLRTGARAVAVAGLISAVLIAPASAMDKVTLLLDWFVNPDHGPIIIAQEKGYFRDAG
ncbi:MAG: ABC transporter substrate-binding protein, partial [Candidatus Puniceispirillum sp.]